MNQCKKCSFTVIDDSIKVCPSCGAKIGAIRGKILLYVIVPLFVIVLTHLIQSYSKSPNISVAQNSNWILLQEAKDPNSGNITSHYYDRSSIFKGAGNVIGVNGRITYNHAPLYEYRYNIDCKALKAQIENVFTFNTNGTKQVYAVGGEKVQMTDWVNIQKDSFPEYLYNEVCR
jgi:hypothetical protein